MAQRLTTSYISTVIPGAYPNVTVKSTPVGIGATGVITIIGEAEGGEDFSNEVLKENAFSPDQLSQVEAKYISGPIVDAFRGLTQPSNDPDIQGSVNQVFILKTNAGAKAQATVDTNYGTLKSKNFGTDGNKVKYQVLESQAEETPSVEGATIAAFGAALDGASFTIRVNGGAATVVTLSNTPADHNNIANLIIELNALLPADVTASAGAATNSLKISIDADSANYRKGWGKAFELYDSSVGDLALLGLVAGLSVSAAESEVEVSIIRTDIGLNEILEAKGEIALSVGYVGTTATLSISATALTTTVVGGAGTNLNILLSDFATVKDLADFIASQTGYSAFVSAMSTQMSPANLDRVSAIGIASTAASLKPGRIKRSMKNFIDALATSSAVDFTQIDFDGLPTPMAGAAFLSGGLKGATTGANYVDALTKLEGVATNFVVPLFSRDASDDIADDLTDSGSTYTIDAINAATKSHCLKMSTPSLKRHRLAVVSYKGTFSDALSKAQSLASYRCAMAFQDVDQVNSAGETETFQPWYGAVIAAGMQAAGFYKGITNKLANVISYRDPSGFDSGSPGDVSQALIGGLLILQSDTAGVKWVSDQTTYGFDNNFVYNSLQASYASDVIALDLAESFQRAFVGKSVADIDRASALAFLQTKMDGYRRIKLITRSDDAPLGYKDADVQIVGPTLFVKVGLKLSTTVYFVPIDIELSQVQQVA